MHPRRLPPHQSVPIIESPSLKRRSFTSWHDFNYDFQLVWHIEWEMGGLTGMFETVGPLKLTTATVYQLQHALQVAVRWFLFFYFFLQLSCLSHPPPSACRSSKLRSGSWVIKHSYLTYSRNTVRCLKHTSTQKAQYSKVVTTLQKVALCVVT